MNQNPKRVYVYLFVYCATLSLFALLNPYIENEQNASPQTVQAEIQAYEITAPPLETLEMPYEPLTPVPLPYEPEWKYPILKRICACESAGNPNAEPVHYDANGDVLRGRINSLDTGMCQINLTYHEAQATRWGYDLMTPDGNKGYAEVLYETQGTAPWTWSAGCWGS